MDVTPEIRAENGPICGYRIVNPHKGKIPFEVIIMMLSIIILMKRMIMVTMDFFERGGWLVGLGTPRK